MDETYQCGRCKQIKTLEDFNPSQRSNGKWCKACLRAWHQAPRGPAPAARPCDYCGKIIDTPAQHRQKYCSANCKQRALWWSRNPREQKSCEACGADITDRRRDTRWCSDECAVTARRDSGSTAESARRHRLKRYGLTPESFDALLASQGGCCAICGSDDPGTKHGKWHVDHDHSCCPDAITARTCGQCVRGLLCNGCNLALGHMNDDVDRLRKAIAYLSR